jgi:hypothetical protein
VRYLRSPQPDTTTAFESHAAELMAVMAGPQIATEVRETLGRLQPRLLVVINAASTVVGRFSPMVRDMGAMMRWFQTGQYVADPGRQRQVFGDVPTAEAATTGRLVDAPSRPWLTSAVQRRGDRPGRRPS